MRVVVVGGGPGGLYAALLLKKGDPSRKITVYDRNPPDATYGWGVVFSDETLGFLEEADQPTYDAITRSFVHWEAIDIHYRGELIRSGGHAFSGLSRRALLNILQSRCRVLGVNLHFQHEITDLSIIGDADLIIAANGVNSHIRRERAHIFRSNLDVHQSKYIWLGMRLPLRTFTFVFKDTEHGMFQIHAYPFEPDLSTCIVECRQDTWKAAGLDQATEAESLGFCQGLFADFFQGHELLSNRSSWINFVTLRNEVWRDGNVVLLGDAAHTAHFSIGSGTKIAMEDAIALSEAVNGARDIPSALLRYEELRQPIVERTQQAARDSSLWFEHVARYARFAPEQFAFSLLTRSKRITYDNLRRRDRTFTNRISTWFAHHEGARQERGIFPGPPPAATSLRIDPLTVINRVALRACAGDVATNGMPAGAHFVRTVAAAIEGAGLVLTDSLAISPDGRITSGCPGLYNDDQRDAWQRIIVAARAESRALIAASLGHAGPRGATRPRRYGVDIPLPRDAWPLMAASALPYAPGGRTPRAMTLEDMNCVCEQFATAARRATLAGFDLLELDFGHGYLLASFLSPLTNRRDDIYSGSIDGRARFPLDVLNAVRTAWPPPRPLAVAFSAADWAPGGITIEEAIQFARMLHDHGCDLIHVVSGQTVYRADPPYGRAWETPLADAIRNEAEAPVMLGGNITSADEANTILAAGRADICLLSSASRRLLQT